jgi:hypothetical protein
LSNARQIGLAAFLYVGDHNDCYPYGLNFSDATWGDPSAWHIMILPYAGSTTNSASKVFACPSEGPPQLPATTSFPSGKYWFQFDYCANEYIFRATSKNPAPLRSSNVRAPASTLMVTEKVWNSPRYMPDAGEWKNWLDEWNTPGVGGSKNSPLSGLDRHSKVLPVLTAADGHTARWRVPPYAPGTAAPISFPGLADTRIDPAPSTSWRSPAAEFFLRDFATAGGF